MSDGLLEMPAGFLWGAATAAHQNEGSNSNNQWSTWEQQPGRIAKGQVCGDAARWWDLETAAADFARAAELGMNSLRLSVEWSRIEPTPGNFDRQAIDNYCEMIKLLRAKGLRPMVTLHHFTDPLWLVERGGWENRGVIDAFARFVTRMVEALGDQVDFWCTINEPIVYAYQGYVSGIFPPGVRNLPRGLNVLRNMLLAHGRAYRIIHTLQSHAQVGLAHNLQLMLPANPASLGDRAAVAILDQLGNKSTLLAISEGRLTPLIGWGQQVTQLIDSMDYLGLNFYTSTLATLDITQPATFFTRRFFDPQSEVSDLTTEGRPYGEINPEGLYLALKQVERYKKPIYITEHGLPDHDDDARPRYLASALAAAWRAVQEGVDLRGYYHWTLVDNFEWCEGYLLRFGLFEADRQTGERRAKDSAAVYQRMARANGVPRRLLETLAPEDVGKYFASPGT